MRDIETKGADPDDPQGKHRGFAARRTALLTLAFVLGLTLGVVVAQRLYVEVNRPPAPGTTQRQQKQQHHALLKVRLLGLFGFSNGVCSTLGVHGVIT